MENSAVAKPWRVLPLISQSQLAKDNMSRNSKNAKRKAAAKQISEQRKNGSKGASRTEAKHGKKNAWWQKFPSYKGFMQGGKRQAADQQ